AKSEGNYKGILAQAGIEFLEVGFNINRTQTLPIEDDPAELDEPSGFELRKGRLGDGRNLLPWTPLAQVDGKQLAVSGVEARRSHAGLGTQRFQNVAGSFCILKGEGSGAVTGQGFRQGGQVGGHGVAQSQEIENSDRQGDRQGGDSRHYDEEAL